MRLWPMLWKELVQLRRDRFTLAMMLGIPAIQLVLFGYAIQTEVRHLATVVLDESRTPESRAAELGGARRPRLEVRVRPWYNPGLRSAVYIVPGIIGVLLSITLVLITSMSIVRERERGTLEQLIVTPIDKTSLILGKILPFLLIGYVQISVILILGRLLFQVPMLGSLPLLYLLSFAFIIASLALGLLMSTLVRSQVQAMQLSFLFLLPNILLSGFMFPREAMPAPAQWIGAALPLTYFLTILRGVLLKNVGLDHLWREGLILVAFAVILVALSVARFQKTIE